MVQALDPAGLRALLESATPPQLVDVRSTAEVLRGVIAGAKHIELGTLSARVGEQYFPIAV
jgi:rhodanese-related sulfurtransferase